MRIAVASDHRGFSVKSKILALLTEMQHAPLDYGPETAEMVDYPGVAAAKEEVLQLLWDNFRARDLGGNSSRAEHFRAWLRQRQATTWRHAVFEAAQAHLHARDPSVWAGPPGRRPAPSSAALLPPCWRARSDAGGISPSSDALLPRIWRCRQEARRRSC